MQQLPADHRSAQGIATISLYKGDRSRLHNDSAVLLHEPIECAPETYLSRLIKYSTGMVTSRDRPGLTQD
jgi:hypothetical protein